MAMVHRLCPEFLLEERIYWLKTPIYKISSGKKITYCYTEDEYAKAAKKGDIIKYKGLGQLSEEDLKESMFDEKWQRMEKICFSEEGLASLISLMGSDSTPRKEFVFNKIDFGEFEL